MKNIESPALLLHDSENSLNTAAKLFFMSDKLITFYCKHITFMSDFLFQNRSKLQNGNVLHLTYSPVSQNIKSYCVYTNVFTLIFNERSRHGVDRMVVGAYHHH